MIRLLDSVSLFDTQYH